MNIALAPGIQVFERGWLSSNNILLTGKGPSTLIDSGYCTHAPQTLALVASVLGEAPLDLLLNTHLHSDHCGGNAALQARYGGLRTWIPPGQAADVSRWDRSALSYEATGQLCPQFHFSGVLQPGGTLAMGGYTWHIHPAGGHDPHSVIFFEPANGILVSADALWEQGFGVVFPELEGISAFADVAATLDLIEDLAPRWVIPGHGRPFFDLGKALAVARSRLQYFAEQPQKHRQHAAKVMLKFKLLELQSCSMTELLQWACQTPYLQQLGRALYPQLTDAQILEVLVNDLIKSGAAQRQGEQIKNGG